MIVMVTASAMAEGESLAETLVGERLAACVNIIQPVRSVFRWQGKVESHDEVLLIIKTTLERYPALEERVRELHSYDLPEVVAMRIECGSAPYLAWLRAETCEHD